MASANQKKGLGLQLLAPFLVKSLLSLVCVALSWSAAASVTYVYDDLNRLTRTTYSSGYTINYDYDGAGTLISVVSGTDTDLDGLINSVDLDDDNDGMTDVYENTHGLDPLDDDDAGLDPDNDGLSCLAEFNKNPGLDPNDPDTDGDGIDDRLDRDPVGSSNACTGAAALFADVVYAGEDITCAAGTSISLEPAAEVQGTGHLELISPIVEMKGGFNIEQAGELSVKSEHPCASCL